MWSIATTEEQSNILNNPLDVLSGSEANLSITLLFRGVDPAPSRIPATSPEENSPQTTTSQLRLTPDDKAPSAFGVHTSKLTTSALSAWNPI